MQDILNKLPKIKTFEEIAIYLKECKESGLITNRDQVNLIIEALLDHPDDEVVLSAGVDSFSREHATKILEERLIDGCRDAYIELALSIRKDWMMKRIAGFKSIGRDMMLGYLNDNRICYEYVIEAGVYTDITQTVVEYSYY